MPEGTTKMEFLKNLISIQDGVLRMSRIIQSMREIAGKSKGAKETVDIYDSFIVTLTMIHNRAKYISAIHLNGAPFSLELQNHDKPCLAFVEKQRIEQVWIIILNNALDALEQNRRFDESLIDISVEESVDGIRIRIEDNAGGIPVDLLPVIFEPFTSTKAHGGMGLGLSIARRIIDEQGGSINVRNSGNGAVFALTLPASPESNTNSAG
jgi:C4-dicarboxylate-specific signal transduction histidine kinase